QRKQAGQVEVRAAKEGAAAGARGGFEALFVEGRLQKSVDRIRIPARVAGVGNRAPDGLAEGPPVPVLAGGEWWRLKSILPGSASVDPFPQHCDLGRAQPASQRHRRLILTCDAAVEQTIIGVARDNRRAFLTALQRGGSAAEIQQRQLLGW